MKEYLPQIIDIVASLVGILLVMALNALKNYLASKTQNETLKGVEDKAINFLATIIKSQQATFVDRMKKDAADGKITAEEFKAAMKVLAESTVKTAKDALGSEVEGILEANYGDVTEYLKHKLEAIVADIKK